MRVRRRWIYIAIISFTLLVIVIFLFLRGFLPSQFRCDGFGGMYSNQIDCGYFQSTEDNQAHILIGIVQKKIEAGGRYGISVRLKDSNKHEYIEDVYFSPNPTTISMLTIPKTSSYLRQSYISVNAEKALKDIRVGEQVKITLLTPPESEVIQAKKELGDIPYLSCFGYHTALVNFLKQSTFANSMSRIWTKYTTNCHATTLQLEKHQ